MALVTGVLSRELYTSDHQLSLLESAVKSVAGFALYKESDAHLASVSAAFQPGSPSQHFLLEVDYVIDGNDVPGNNPGHYWYVDPTTGLLLRDIFAPDDATKRDFIDNKDITTPMLRGFQAALGRYTIASLLIKDADMKDSSPVGLGIFPKNIELEQIGVLVDLRPEARWVEL